MSEHAVPINTLKYLAIQNNRSLAPDEDLEKQDVTEILWKEINDTLVAGELNNIQILGGVIEGKSTVMAAIVHFGNKKLDTQMSLQFICADQLEFSRKVMNPKLMNCFVGIDEWNKLSETGYNASVESAFLEYFSDVQAQRFIHRISCSPRGLVDPNATIILECLGKNKESKVTRVIVKYRLLQAEGEQIQVVGHADIFVGEVMKTKWYKQYRERKFKKMELVTQEGVRDIREMEYSELVLRVFRKLRNLAKMGLVNRDLINGYVETERRKDKRFLSILTTDDIISKVMGILRLVKEQTRIQNEMEKAVRMSNKAGNGAGEYFRDKIETLKKILEEVKDNEKELLANYEKLVQINEKYKAI